MERATGKPHPRLVEHTLPDGCGSLWRDFLALRMAAGSNGMGPNRITFAEIEAYQRLHGFRFAAWEVRAITGADAAYFAVRAEARG